MSDEALVLLKNESALTDVAKLAAVSHSYPPRLAIVSASAEQLDTLRNLPGVAAVFERGQPTPAFEQLDPNERLFAEAWAVAGQPKSRIGDGLKWDTPGFDPP